MKVEYLNPFITGTYEILKQLGISETKRGKINLCKGGIKINSSAVIIGLTGDINGRVIYDMDIQTSLNIAELIIGEKRNSFDEMVKSAVGEFANMVTGRAISILAEKGYKFKISPPTLFTGNKMEISDINIPALVVPIECELGTIIVNLALRKK